MIFDNIEDAAYALLNEFRRITIPLLMRRFKLNAESSTKLCHKLWLRQHLEARKYAKELEM
jgi:hypothetical protein